MEDRTYQQALEDARPILAQLQARITGILDQVAAVWRDIEPILRAGVAAGDALTESEWMDQAEATRAEYECVKAILARYDQDRLDARERSHDDGRRATRRRAPACGAGDA